MAHPEKTIRFDADPPREPHDRRELILSRVVSVAMHVLFLAFFIGFGGGEALLATLEIGAGDGIGAGPAGGGGGGGQEDGPVILMAIDEPPPAPVAPPEIVPPPDQLVSPIPVPEPEIRPVAPPVTVSLPLDTLPTVTVSAAPLGGSGTGTGAGAGPGTGAGTGPGSGGGSGGGEGGGIGSGFGPGTGRGKLLGPSPEVLLIPPPAPGGVRGKTVVVRLSVDENGVVKDAEIMPSTGDRKYDTALKRVALGWKFRAARDAENKPVAVLYDVTFTF